jgi:hypothetical protein
MHGSHQDASFSAFVGAFRAAETHGSADERAVAQGSGMVRLLNNFEDFMDHAPRAVFRLIGAIAALVAIWFALALLGGLPRGAVEWIALAMVGVFTYVIGFGTAVVLAFLLARSTRFTMVIALAVGTLALYALALPVQA